MRTHGADLILKDTSKRPTQKSQRKTSVRGLTLSWVYSPAPLASLSQLRENASGVFKFHRLTLTVVKINIPKISGNPHCELSLLQLRISSNATATVKGQFTRQRTVVLNGYSHPYLYIV